MDQLGFTIPDVYHGFAEVGGVAMISVDGLRLQWETRDTLIGCFRTRVSEILVPWSELVAAEYRTNLFGRGSLRLRTVSLQSLGDIPGRQGNELELRFGRDRRHEARDFADRLQLRAAHETVADIHERLRQLGA
jgi:hypothetical protein